MGPLRERDSLALSSVDLRGTPSGYPIDNTALNYAWRKKTARVYVERTLAGVCNVNIPELVR